MADNVTFDELPRLDADLRLPPLQLPTEPLTDSELTSASKTTMDEPESVVLPDPGELPFLNSTTHLTPSQPVEMAVFTIERNLGTPPPGGTEPQASSSLSSNSSASTMRSHALPPITVDQLNQPHYIIGASTFYDSFFGGTELERYFPDRKMRLSVITWNMNSNPPADYNQTLQELLNLNENSKGSPEELPEMYVMGLQEAPSADHVIDSIKVGMQACLGPNYVLLKWTMLGTLHASIWMRRELLWSCTAVEVVPINLRPHPANRIRTKGAIALSFCLFGTTFLFINTHLSAHETNLRTRMNQLDKMQRILNLRNDRRENGYDNVDSGSGGSRGRTPNLKTYRSRNSEYIFWFGDLNFRLELPGDSVLDFIKQIAAADNPDSKLEIQKELMRSDQLNQLMSRGIIFAGFEEAQWPPPFLPTYKCKVGGRKDSIDHHWMSQRPRPLTPVGLALHETAAHLRHSDSDSISSSPKQQRGSRQSTASSDTTATSSDLLNGDVLGESTSRFDSTEDDLTDATTRQMLERLMRMSQGYELTRVPSYTDRILYQAVPGKSQEKLPMGSLLRCFQYTAHIGLNTSDHKPVTALLELSLEPGGPRLPTRIKRLSQMMEEIKLKNREPNISISSSGTNLNKIKRRFFSRKPAKNSAKSKEAQRNLKAMSMSRLDRLAQLNAGAFDRNIYIEGLRLRNNLLQHQGSMDCDIELPKPITSKRSREMVKSRSLDSNVIDLVEVDSLDYNDVDDDCIEASSNTGNNLTSKRAQPTEPPSDGKSTSSVCAIM